jgi:hypothetical protein
MKTLIPSVVIFAGAAILLPAQSTQSMRANIRGGGGDVGKCTIEVTVDGAADVEIRGDSGRIRTLQGQPSSWRRFECTSPIPPNPVDFRFRGVDGRGNVSLLRDPSSTGGTAVVRIADPKGGQEGYTFDLEWRGGAYSSNTPYGYGNNRDPYYNNRDPYNNNDPYYRDNRRNTRSRTGYGNSDEARGAAMCQDAVRARARSQYGVRNPAFTAANVDDLRGNRDRVVGGFQGNRGEYYEYTCTVNPVNGNIRNVDIRRR